MGLRTQGLELIVTSWWRHHNDDVITMMTSPLWWRHGEPPRQGHDTLHCWWAAMEKETMITNSSGLLRLSIVAISHRRMLYTAHAQCIMIWHRCKYWIFQNDKKTKDKLQDLWLYRTDILDLTSHFPDGDRDVISRKKCCRLVSEHEASVRRSVDISWSIVHSYFLFMNEWINTMNYFQ